MFKNYRLQVQKKKKKKAELVNEQTLPKAKTTLNRGPTHRKHRKALCVH